MYPSSINEEEFKEIEGYMNTNPVNGGRPTVHSKKEILNAILYVLKTGCQWRQLPHDFPKWTTVYSQFRRWLKDGTFAYINKRITTQTEEVLIDSRSVRASHELKKKIKVLTDIK